jgi:hypothetical protein
MNSIVRAPEPWASLHVFIHDYARLNHFLCECVAELPSAARREMFFIRYWHGGPHLRIRIRPQWQEIVEARIRGYLAAHAFTSSLQPQTYYRAYTELLPAEQAAGQSPPWYENGSIQPIPYVPEVQRYGGPRCMPLVEEFFVWDSAQILELLLTDAALAEKVLLGYCLTHAEVLCNLHAQASIITAPWYAESAYQAAQRSITSQAGKLHALRNRWQTGTLYPQYIQPLRDKLVTLGRQMQQQTLAPIGDIFNSLLHMSFNRAAIAPLQETWIRCWAANCGGVTPQSVEDT